MKLCYSANGEPIPATEHSSQSRSEPPFFSPQGERKSVQEPPRRWLNLTLKSSGSRIEVDRVLACMARPDAPHQFGAGVVEAGWFDSTGASPDAVWVVGASAEAGDNS